MSLSINKISRYMTHVIMSLAFVLLATNPASSIEQDPIIYAFYCPSEEIPFIGELMPPVLHVLEDDKVKAELALSNSQVEKLREVDKAFLAGLKDILTHNDGSRSIEDHVVAIGKLSEDARKRTNEILKPHQMSRMREILLQLYGVLFVPKKDLRQLLRLDRDQERAIDEIRSGVFRRIDETASPGRCKFVTSTKRDISILLEKGEKSVYLLLSPEQKATVEKLKGKPFSF